MIFRSKKWKLKQLLVELDQERDKELKNKIDLILNNRSYYEVDKKGKEELLEKIVEYNESILNDDHSNQDDERIIKFHYDKTGQNIYDPFYDTTYRFEVDPFEEYGEEYVNKFINNALEK